MVDVVGVGANSLDLVYVLPEHPRPDSPSSKLRISEHRLSPGGQTATTLCACAALGLRASYVGAFGSDENGRRAREALSARGVLVDAAVTRDAPNRYAVILIDARHGERVVLWDKDPRLSLTTADLPRTLLTNARVVHVDDEDEEMAIVAARIARDAGVPVTSDIDRVTSRTAELADTVSVPIFAEHVPLALTGAPDMEGALRALRRTHHTMLCATLGARGAALLEGDRYHEAPACRVDPVDTTGAGDVFRGAFIDALLRNDPPARMLRFANAAAALACTRHGAIGGVPTRDEVERMAGMTR
jgi:sugar/nucleoside kinase (ribokinase family)